LENDEFLETQTSDEPNLKMDSDSNIVDFNGVSDSEQKPMESVRSTSKRKLDLGQTTSNKKKGFRDEFYEKRELALEKRLSFDQDKLTLEYEKHTQQEQIESKKLEFEKEKHLYEKQRD
jgi:hypothetical protein